MKSREELEQRGFRVHITQHISGRTRPRFYCRIRNPQMDRTFYGDTGEISLAKAIDSLQPEAAQPTVSARQVVVPLNDDSVRIDQAHQSL